MLCPMRPRNLYLHDLLNLHRDQLEEQVRAFWRASFCSGAARNPNCTWREYCSVCRNIAPSWPSGCRLSRGRTPSKEGTAMR